VGNCQGHQARSTLGSSGTIDCRGEELCWTGAALTRLPDQVAHHRATRLGPRSAGKPGREAGLRRDLGLDMCAGPARHEKKSARLKPVPRFGTSSLGGTSTIQTETPETEELIERAGRRGQPPTGRMNRVCLNRGLFILPTARLIDTTENSRSSIRAGNSCGQRPLKFGARGPLIHQYKPRPGERADPLNSMGTMGPRGKGTSGQLTRSPHPPPVSLLARSHFRRFSFSVSISARFCR
jgi:hypothetical protein